MSNLRKQVCIIHGGNTYRNDEEFLNNLQNSELDYERLLYAPSWRDWCAERLTDWDVILPSMPNKQNAKYSEWSLYFSKIIPLLDSSAVLVGHSLGGIFLAKYLSENQPDLSFAKLILVTAPYNDETIESLGDYKIFDTKKLSSAADEIHILHSKDDPVVSFDEAKRYKADLPDAKLHVFDDRQHFVDSTFPELLEIIKSN